MAELDSFIPKGSSGKIIAVTQNTSNNYSLSMPTKQVIVASRKDKSVNLRLWCKNEGKLLLLDTFNGILQGWKEQEPMDYLSLQK